jgi:hypothetical protein
MRKSVYNGKGGGVCMNSNEALELTKKRRKGLRTEEKRRNILIKEQNKSKKEKRKFETKKEKLSNRIIMLGNKKIKRAIKNGEFSTSFYIFRNPHTGYFNISEYDAPIFLEFQHYPSFLTGIYPELLENIDEYYTEKGFSFSASLRRVNSSKTSVLLKIEWQEINIFNY